MADNVTGKISRKTIERIFESLRAAMTIKCDDVLFDQDGIFARAIETNILMIQPLDNEFEFTALGIGRISDLYSRLKLVIDDETLTGTFEEFREGRVGKLVFKTKKTKVEFKCKDPTLVKVRKTLKDPIVLSFNLNADAIRFMTAGTAAMKNTSVTFHLDDGKMFMRLLDSEGDVLDHVITNDVTLAEDADETQSFSYDIPKLAPLLNAHKENTKVNISQRGIMNLSSDGFSIYLIPDL